MVRITIDIDEGPGVLATKEAVAMALEHLGRVRVISVTEAGGERKS